MKSQKPSRVTQTIERNMMDFKGGKTGNRMSSCFTMYYGFSNRCRSATTMPFPGVPKYLNFIFIIKLSTTDKMSSYYIYVNTKSRTPHFKSKNSTFNMHRKFLEFLKG